MKKTISTLLIVVAIICFAIALSYPVEYLLQKNSNEKDMDDLRQMRWSALENSADPKSQSRTAGELAGHGPTLAPTDESAVDRTDYAQPQGNQAVEFGLEEKEKAAMQQASTQVPMDKMATAKADMVSATTQPIPALTEPVMEGKQSSTHEPRVLGGTPSIFPAETFYCADLMQDKCEGNLSSDSEEKELVSDQENLVSATPVTEEVATPLPTIFDRYYRESSALPYPDKEKVQFDENEILPQYREIYEKNHDLVGWISIPNSPIDYPVMQSEDSDYYLQRDFYGEENANGQLILDSACDPWTPSYNLVISGHNMNSGKMFASIANYNSKTYWQSHKIITYDSLIREGAYVVVAAFYSADYDVDEEGFRYNADIQYRLDLDLWMKEIEENRLYDTGIDVEFGDEFLTLTTCVYQRENGRFVVVARRVREGEVIES